MKWAKWIPGKQSTLLLLLWSFHFSSLLNKIADKSQIEETYHTHPRYQIPSNFKAYYHQHKDQGIPPKPTFVEHGSKHSGWTIGFGQGTLHGDHRHPSLRHYSWWCLLKFGYRVPETIGMYRSSSSSATATNQGVANRQLRLSLFRFCICHTLFRLRSFNSFCL